MSTLKLPAVVPIKRVYPHVDAIVDPMAQQSTKLAWDRIHDLEERLQAQEKNAQLLAAAHDLAQTQIAVARTTAESAMAIAQQPTVGAASLIGSGGGTGTGAGEPVGPAAGELGSQTNPIIAMSADPAAIATSVRLSLQSYGIGFNPSVDEYWIGHADHVGQFSNGKWYLGWNAYWHARANPSNTGSADPNLAGEPSPAG
jgi:hypothetical protein